MKNEARIALSLSMLAAAVLALVVWSARPLASAPARAPEPLQPSAAREPLAPAEHWEADPGATTPSARIEVAAPDLDWTLLGRVVDHEGRPVREFGVRAQRRAELGQVLEERLWDVAEHSNGEFALENLAPGAWLVSPFAPRCVLLMPRRFFEPESRRLEYRLMPWGRVSGSVFAPTGAPLPYARLFVEQAVVAQADELGRFEFARTPGQVSLRAESAEFCSGPELALEITRERELEGLALMLGWPTELRVRLRGASGAPLEGWTVALTSLQERAALGSSARTDRFGLAIARVTLRGALECSILDPRGTPFGTCTVDAECGEQLSLELSHPPGPPVRVRGHVDQAALSPSSELIGPFAKVRFERGSIPLHSRAQGTHAEVVVSARCLEPGRCVHRELRAELAEGRFEIELPGAGNWEFSMQDQGAFGSVPFERVQVDVPAVEVFEFDWRD